MSLNTPAHTQGHILYGDIHASKFYLAKSVEKIDGKNNTNNELEAT